jgi:hypothetical protein
MGTAGIIAKSYPRQPGGDTSNRQPDGEQWFEDGLNYSDVTVRHPVSVTYLRHACKVGKILDDAVKAKLVRYLSFASERDASFSALAINSYGSLSEEFYNFLRKIATHAENSPISNITNATAFLNTMVQDVVATLMQGNAWMYRRGVYDSRRRFGNIFKAADDKDIAAAIARQSDAKRNELLFDKCSRS